MKKTTATRHEEGQLAWQHNRLVGAVKLAVQITENIIEKKYPTTTRMQEQLAEEAWIELGYLLKNLKQFRHNRNGELIVRNSRKGKSS